MITNHHPNTLHTQITYNIARAKTDVKFEARVTLQTLGLGTFYSIHVMCGLTFGALVVCLVPLISYYKHIVMRFSSVKFLILMNIMAMSSVAGTWYFYTRWWEDQRSEFCNLHFFLVLLPWIGLYLVLFAKVSGRRQGEAGHSPSIKSERWCTWRLLNASEHPTSRIRSQTLRSAESGRS